MNASSLLDYTQRKWLFLSWDWQHEARLRHDGLTYRLELPRTKTEPAVELELLPAKPHCGTQVRVTTETDSWIANVHFYAQNQVAA